jgi:rubrerythrin
MTTQRPPWRDPALPPRPEVDQPMREMWRCPVCQPTRLNYQHCERCPLCGEPNPTPKDNPR